MVATKATQYFLRHHTLSIRACISIAEREWTAVWKLRQNGHSKYSAEACGLHSQTPTVNEILSWPTLLDSLEIPQNYQRPLVEGSARR